MTTDTPTPTETDTNTLLELRRKQLEIIDDEINYINGYITSAKSRLEVARNAFRPDDAKIQSLHMFLKSQESDLYIHKCDRDIVLTEIKILSLKF